MRVIGYVRVSTEEQATGGVSLAAQRAKVAGYAALYELELVEVIEDAGISGKTLERPGLERALELVRKGKADGVLVAKLDRLTRSVADMAELIDCYFSEKAGKVLLSVADQVDTRTAAGRLVLNILVGVSQWERETIGERTRDALRHKRSVGETFNHAPLGYRVEAGRLVADVEEQATVARANELRAAGASLQAIAATLTAEGRRTKRGGRWHPVTVQKLIGRPVAA